MSKAKYTNTSDHSISKQQQIKFLINLYAIFMFGHLFDSYIGHNSMSIQSFVTRVHCIETVDIELIDYFQQEKLSLKATACF